MQSPQTEAAAEARSLDELALLHGTDKSSRRHDFAVIYEGFLAPVRDQPVTMLEIGVLKGASLRMWRDFFAEGRIFAIDHNESAREYEAPGTQVFVGDQEDVAFLEEVTAETGPLDLVIDDGGHRAEQQQGSLRFLWPHLKPGGTYVIEDVHTSYLERYDMGWRQPGTTIEFAKDVVDDVYRRYHKQQVTLGNDVASIHFHRELCIIHKRKPKSRG